MTATTWQPKEVDGLALAFGGKMTELLPAMVDIPAEFKSGHGTWVNFQQDWFFHGLPKGTVVNTKPGIDRPTAIKHLIAIQRSWEPQHEHKQAGVAYLASLWFESVVTPTKTYGGAQ